MTVFSYSFGHKSAPFPCRNWSCEKKCTKWPTCIQDYNNAWFIIWTPLCKDLLICGRNTSPTLILWKSNSGRTRGASFGGIFWTISLCKLKKFKKFLMRIESNFNLSPLKALEDSHWVAQTWPFFAKLWILAFYSNLRIRHDSKFAKFWPRVLIT